MKKSLIFFTALLALVLTGCGAKPYVDVETKDYATLQLVPKSETLLFTDDYYAFIYDYSKKCDFSNFLGILETDSDTSSRTIKIPVNKPLYLNLNYRMQSGNSTYTEYTRYVLIPEKNRHYVFEYAKKDLGLFKGTISEFDAYILEDGKMIRIPPSKLRGYKDTECNDD